MLLLVFLTIQLLLGVMTRHFEGTPGYMHALITHITNSVIVAAIAIGAGLRTRQCLAPSMNARSPDRLTRLVGTGVMHTTILQMLLAVGALGAVMIWRESDPWPEVLVTTRTRPTARRCSRSRRWRRVDEAARAAQVVSGVADLAPRPARAATGLAALRAGLGRVGRPPKS